MSQQTQHTHTHTSAACVHSVMDTDSVLAFRAAGKEIKCNKWAAFLRDGKLCMHASSISTPQLLNALLPNASKSPASVFVLFISLQCLCIYSYCIYSIHQWHWSSTVVCLLAGRCVLSSSCTDGSSVGHLYKYCNQTLVGCQPGEV